jgi:ABC-type transport system involved in multi-copper enzyme maturation permease subunit
MLKSIISCNLKQNLLSFRLQVLFVIITLAFFIGGVGFIVQNRFANDEYNIYIAKTKDLQERSDREFLSNAVLTRNITSTAVEMQNYVFKPLQNYFIENGKSQYIPNTITYNAFNVFSYNISRSSGNPYLVLSEDLNWTFIISVILSFAVLLLSFDSISGERELHTLTLMLSNGVSRFSLFSGKYISIVLTGFILTLPGIILSLLLLILSGSVNFNTILFFELAIFTLILLMYIACIAILGMFCSVIARSSNISLLLCLTLWAVFLIFAPNIAVFSADTLFKTKNSESILQEVESAKEAINKAAPEGSWSMNSNDPFYAKHKLRADNQMNLMNAEKQIKDKWYKDQFSQYRSASYLTCLSPVSLYGFINESLTGNGFPRFEKNWNDLHIFQTQFFEWFREKDLNDPKSPHWFNPYEDCSTSRLPVQSDFLPVYREDLMTVSDRFQNASPRIILLILYTLVLFIVTAKYFSSYDVR